MGCPNRWRPPLLVEDFYNEHMERVVQANFDMLRALTSSQPTDLRGRAHVVQPV